jgi:hypothetical protein
MALSYRCGCHILLLRQKKLHTVDVLLEAAGDQKIRHAPMRRLGVEGEVMRRSKSRSDTRDVRALPAAFRAE